MMLMREGSLWRWHSSFSVEVRGREERRDYGMRGE
jgi:hypothetical protein